MELFILFLTFIVMFIGLIGTIVPILPGVVITGGAAFVYAWYTGFTEISLIAALFIALLTLFGASSDLWLPLLGAQSSGASGRSLLFGLLGSFIGLILGLWLPIIGSLIGAVAGYVVGLILAAHQEHGDWNQAIKVGLGGLVGWGVATVVQVVTAVVIIFLFTGLILWA